MMAPPSQHIRATIKQTNCGVLRIKSYAVTNDDGRLGVTQHLGDVRPLIASVLLRMD